MIVFNLSKNASTCIKGLSCLLIILHHWFMQLQGAGYHNIFVGLISVRGGVTGVAVFFFLSSYGLTRSQMNHKDSLLAFVKKRIAKLLIPLVLTNIAWLAVAYHGEGSIDLTARVLNIYDLPDPVTWFCNVIIFCYCFFYVSFSVKTVWLKILCSWSLMVAFACVLTAIFPERPFYVHSLIAFPIGQMVALCQSRMSIWKLVLLILLVSIVTLGMVSIFMTDYWNRIFGNLFSCGVILCLMIAVSLLNANDRIKRFIPLSLKSMVLFMGTYSYEIYLCHNKYLFLIFLIGRYLWYPIVFLTVIIPSAIGLSVTCKSIVQKCRLLS